MANAHVGRNCNAIQFNFNPITHKGHRIFVASNNILINPKRKAMRTIKITINGAIFAARPRSFPQSSRWVTHYNQGRPHSSLGPGIPEPGELPRIVCGRQRHFLAQDSRVVARAILGGLHHEYRLEKVAA